MVLKTAWSKVLKTDTRTALVSVSVGLIYQLVGIGTFLAGSGLLLAVLIGHRRLLLMFGIGCPLQKLRFCWWAWVS